MRVISYGKEKYHSSFLNKDSLSESSSWVPSSLVDGMSAWVPTDRTCGSPLCCRSISWWRSRLINSRILRTALALCCFIQKSRSADNLSLSMPSGQALGSGLKKKKRLSCLIVEIACSAKFYHLWITVSTAVSARSFSGSAKTAVTWLSAGPASPALLFSWWAIVVRKKRICENGLIWVFQREG